MTSGRSRQSSRPRELRRRDRVGFRQGLRAEDVRDIVGQDRDRADRLLRIERAEPLDDPHRREPRDPQPSERLDRDQIAVAGIVQLVLRHDVALRGILLVDRFDATVPVAAHAQYAELTHAVARQNLDDAAEMGRAVGLRVVESLQAEERTVTDARHGRSGIGRSRRGNQDPRRRPVLGRVPIGRPRDQFSVVVARDDVGHDHRRQGTAVRGAAALLEMALVPRARAARA